MLNEILKIISTESYVMVFVANYIALAIVFCKLSIKANIEDQWLAFVPIIQIVLFLHIIDRSGFYILLLIIPVVNIILMEVWFSELYSFFRINIVWTVISLAVYPINCIYMIYMSYSPKIKYLSEN